MYPRTSPVPSARARRAVPAALAFVVGVGLLVAATPSGASADGPDIGFDVTAIGVSGHLGSVFNPGARGIAPLCTTEAGVHRTNDIQRLTATDVGTIGRSTTRASSERTTSSTTAVGRATTAASALFDRAITTGEMTAVATTAHSSHGYVSTGRTTLSNVKIAGHTMPTNPAVNQRVTIPGVGTATLNQQTKSNTAGSHGIAVVAMRIVVTRDNSLGLPAGSFAISTALAALHEPTYRTSSGSAYGLRVEHAGKIERQDAAAIALPCGGSDGLRLEKSASATGDPTLDADTIHSTGRSTDSKGESRVAMLSQVNDLSLGDGAITANSVTSRAVVVRTENGLARTSRGTTFDALTVNGHKQPATAAPNTTVSVPGVGMLVLHRVVKTTSGIEVYAMQLTLTSPLDGMRKGTVITVGAAKAAVTKNR